MSRKLIDVLNLRNLLERGKPVRRICSLSDLLEFAGQVNKQGKNFDGWIVNLECDIDLSETPWEPIGYSLDTPFCGEFDGKGHTIWGLTLRTDAHFAGFFGVVKGFASMGIAEVRKLCLQEVALSGTTDISWTGGIAGYAGDGALIERCHVTGDIRSWSFVGGIIGVADGSVGIRNCRTEGVIVGENLSDIIARNYAAGTIAGKYTTNSIMQDCHDSVVRKNGTPLFNQVGKFDDIIYADREMIQTSPDKSDNEL